MAHFARIENNLVTEIIVVANEELLVDGVESETKGIEFCQNLFGGEWVQTSYNGKFRKNYAGIGYLYDPLRDAFIPPKLTCHEEVYLDENIIQWICTNIEHEPIK